MALGFVRRHKWRILGGTVVVGASIAVWRALRGIPLRQIIAMVSQARDRSQGEVDMALKSGDGTRLFVACLRDLRNDLSSLVDVQEKQAAAKVIGRENTEERLRKVQELSNTTLTRTISAVYVVSAMQLLIQAQVFQLVRLQRQGRHLEDEAQRRFLTLVKTLHTGEGSILAALVQRVEAAVRNQAGELSMQEPCDRTRLSAIFDAIRKNVDHPAKGQECGPAGAAWVAALLLEVLERSVTANMQGQPLHEALMPDGGLGLRGEAEVQAQIDSVLLEMGEVVQSELFADAMADVLDTAFARLSQALSAKLFPGAHSASEAGGPEGDAAAGRPDSDSAGVHQCVGEISEERTAPKVPFMKVMPAVNNLFAVVMHPDSSAGGSFSTLALNSDACRSLFVAMLAPPGYS